MNRMINDTTGVMIYIMYCSNSAGAGLPVNFMSGEHNVKFKTISVPCSGKVDLLYLVKAFETGADGVVLLACPPDRCRHLEGSARSNVRADSVNSLLAEAGIDGERVSVIAMDSSSPEITAAGINEFVFKIQSIHQACALSA